MNKIDNNNNERIKQIHTKSNYNRHPIILFVRWINKFDKWRCNWNFRGEQGDSRIAFRILLCSQNAFKVSFLMFEASLLWKNFVNEEAFAWKFYCYIENFLSLDLNNNEKIQSHNIKVTTISLTNGSNLRGWKQL